MAIANILSTSVQNPVEKDLKDFSLSDSLGLFQRSKSNGISERVSDKQFRLYSEKLDDKLNKISELLVPAKSKEIPVAPAAPITAAIEDVKKEDESNAFKFFPDFSRLVRALGKLLKAAARALSRVLRFMKSVISRAIVAARSALTKLANVARRMISPKTVKPPTTPKMPGTPERAPIYDEKAKRFRDPKTGRFVKAPKEIVDSAVKRRLPKILSGLGPKALPFGIGAAVGAIFGTLRWLEGDTVGAALEVAVGASAAIPAVGTAAAIMGTVALAGRDIYNELYGEDDNKFPFDSDLIKNPDLIAERMPEITEQVKKMVQEALRARELSKEETDAILNSVKLGGTLDQKTKRLIARNPELQKQINDIRSGILEEQKKYGTTSMNELLQKREEERQQQRVLQQAPSENNENEPEGNQSPNIVPSEIMGEPPPEQPDISEQQNITPIIVNNTSQTVVNKPTSRRGSLKTPWSQAVEG